MYVCVCVHVCTYVCVLVCGLFSYIYDCIYVHVDGDGVLYGCVCVCVCVCVCQQLPPSLMHTPGLVHTADSGTAQRPMP